MTSEEELAELKELCADIAAHIGHHAADMTQKKVRYGPGTESQYKKETEMNFHALTSDVLNKILKWATGRDKESPGQALAVRLLALVKEENINNPTSLYQRARRSLQSHELQTFFNPVFEPTNVEIRAIARFMHETGSQSVLYSLLGWRLKEFA